jgi:hypothetical protein
VISHYRYWMKGLHSGSQPDHNIVVLEKWSFERFALGEEFRNLYSQLLVGFPLEAFREPLINAGVSGGEK